MKSNKRIKIVAVLVSIIFILTCLYGNVNASELNTKLEVVKISSEVKYLDNDQGEISKKIVESNSETGEVTIELKISNNPKELNNTDTEVFLVVDNSPSMDFVTSSGETRKEIVLNSAYKLVDKIYDTYSNIKIGLVEFHGRGLGESAGIHNGKVKQKLTDNKTEMLNAIDNLKSASTSSGTNIDAGLRTAQKSFSSDSKNKVIILLTDGIPNNDADGRNSSDDVTTENAKKIQERTKQTLEELKSNGIYTITMLTGMSEEDGNTDKKGRVYTKVNSLEEELEAAERIFGTPENPTADKYYLVRSVDVDNIINTDILKDITVKIRNPINNIKIVDYFPEDITENFEFSFVQDPNFGTAGNIDAETKTMSWDMDTLKDREIATLRYKLKIKDMKNTNLLNKTIKTNEKVVLTYNDVDSNEYTVILDSSPEVKLEEQEVEESDETPNVELTTGNQEENNNNQENVESTTDNQEENNNNQENVEQTNVEQTNVDPTVVPVKTLPQTGENITIACIIIATITFSIVGYKKLKRYENIK